jgi:dethiobiotin synthetase
MSIPGLFITGTDTEVGKTLVSAAMIHLLQQKGLQAVGFKPVVAGVSNIQGELINEDIETLLQVSRTVAPNLLASDMCPYFLDDPAAPHLVAKRGGYELQIQVMLTSYRKLAQQFETVVVEGAGGFLVPIHENLTLGDFAVELQLPVILVVSIRLGCINHALLSAEAILHRNLKLLGWVANQTGPSDSYTQENIDTLKNIFLNKYAVPCMGSIPFFEKPANEGLYSLSSIEKASNYLSFNPEA